MNTQKKQLNSTKFKYELSQIKTLALSEELSYYDKGEIYSHFIAKYGMLQKDLSESLGESLSTVNRAIVLYQKINCLDEKTKQELEGLGDRLKLVLLRLDSKEKIDFMIMEHKGMTTGEIETIVSILNNEKDLKIYEDKIEEQYKKRRKFIDKLRKMIK